MNSVKNEVNVIHLKMTGYALKIISNQRELDEKWKKNKRMITKLHNEI